MGAPASDQAAVNMEATAAAAKLQVKADQLAPRQLLPYVGQMRKLFFCRPWQTSQPPKIETPINQPNAAASICPHKAEITNTLATNAIRSSPHNGVHTENEWAVLHKNVACPSPANMPAQAPQAIAISIVSLMRLSHRSPSRHTT